MVGKKEDKVGGGDDSAVPECGVFILFFDSFSLFFFLFLCFFSPQALGTLMNVGWPSCFITPFIL